MRRWQRMVHIPRLGVAIMRKLLVNGGQYQFILSFGDISRRADGKGKCEHLFFYHHLIYLHLSPTFWCTHVMWTNAVILTEKKLHFKDWNENQTSADKWMLFSGSASSLISASLHLQYVIGMGNHLIDCCVNPSTYSRFISAAADQYWLLFQNVINLRIGLVWVGYLLKLNGSLNN